MEPKIVIGLCIGAIFGFVLSSLHKSVDTIKGPNAGDVYKGGYATTESVGRDAKVSQHFADEEQDGDTEARRLAKTVRVLCWVMTTPKNHKTKAIHIKRTWGQRCNKLLFMSSTEDKTLPTVALPNVTEGRQFLWAKTKEAFKYVYKHHLEEADWFMKADDDAYVIVENLRHMLNDYDPEQPLYFGCRYRPFVKQGYMSGGAGYVLSKEALKRFVETAIPMKNATCPTEGHPTGHEDIGTAKCMEGVGVQPVDTRDNLGRYRFFPQRPEHHLTKTGHSDPYFWYPEKRGFRCCSDNAISFHYISPNQMYVMEYLIYHLRPYGVSRHFKPPDPDIIEDTTTKPLAQNNATNHTIRHFTSHITPKPSRQGTVSTIKKKKSQLSVLKKTSTISMYKT